MRLTSITPTVDRTPNAPTQPDYLRALSYMPAMTAPVRAGGGNRTVQNHTTNQFTITGITNPEEAARRVAAILDERARRQRDEAHPRTRRSDVVQPCSNTRPPTGSSPSPSM